ncbi:hypothetical protein L1080_008955 [Rhodococcus sp. MSC1_016]|uniref:hypothetical protein n=1 Tax=Rhodococcus sp. MSC1_016 TaxID=2909266 RepID=UPI00202E09AB|nr:hypothetical protein [Rhodococcus sp. MSC1_016]
MRRGADIDDPVGGGGGTLFTEPVRVGNQRANGYGGAPDDEIFVPSGMTRALRRSARDQNL